MKSKQVQSTISKILYDKLQKYNKDKYSGHLSESKLIRIILEDFFKRLENKKQKIKKGLIESTYQVSNSFNPAQVKCNYSIT